MLGVANTAKTVDSELNECATTTHNIDELFGAFGCTHGPKTATNATGHYYNVVIIVHIVLYLSPSKHVSCRGEVKHVYMAHTCCDA